MPPASQPDLQDRLARAVTEATVDGVITIDEAGCIGSFNPAAERIFGYAADEVVGRNVRVLMPEPYHAEHDGYLRAYHETGRRRIIGIGREVTGQRKDGSTFPMDLAVSEVALGPDGAEGKWFAGIVRDISERRRLEQEVLRVAEAERRRIGQDLHDGLGQMLTGTALLARGLARRLASAGADEAEAAEEVVRYVKEADAFARRLARGLVPVELEAGGLAAALERLAQSAGTLLGIACAVRVMGEEAPLSDPAPTHLFRIAQEALSNAARHGRASHVTFSLAYGADRVRLRVEDDGIGVSEAFRSSPPAGEQLQHREESAHGSSAPIRPEDPRGMGVRIMHYRARVIGGSLEIRPGSGGGTVVTCTVPLRPPSHAGDAGAR